MRGRIILLFCLWCFALQAQTVSVKLSNSFLLRDHGGTDKEGMTFWYKDNFYCVETVNQSGVHLIYTLTLNKIRYNINLYRYDKEMNEVKKVTLDAPDHFGPFEPYAAVFEGKIWVFYYQMPDKSGIDLMYSVVDPETLAADPGKKLGTITEPNAWGGKSLEAMANNHLRVAFSPDTSKMMLAQIGNTPDVMTFLLDKNGPIGKPRVSHFEEAEPKTFSIDEALVDNAGDRLFTYKFWQDKRWQQGVLVQNAHGRDKWIDMEPMQDGLEAGVVFLHLSTLSDKIYAYGPYTSGKLDRGIFLTTLDLSKLRLARAEIFPYSPEVIMKLDQLDYVDKEHKDLGVKRAYYGLDELADSTVVLSGYPVNAEVYTHTKMIGMNAGSTTSGIDHYAGPLLNIFIRKGKCVVGIIPRSQEQTVASDFIAIPYKDKLVCIYTDNEKSLETDDPKVNKKQYRIDQLVLAYAVTGSDGTVLERKKLADRDGNLSFFTAYKENLGNNNFLIPMCKFKLGFARYYLEMGRWAVVKVE